MIFCQVFLSSQQLSHLVGQHTLAQGKLGSVGSVQTVHTVGAHNAQLQTPVLAPSAMEYLQPWGGNKHNQ